MIAGEPLPVGKEAGDKVVAGTINSRGTFVLETTGVGSDTLLARIIRMVQQAQGSKAPVQRIADRIAAFRTDGHRHRAADLRAVAGHRRHGLFFVCLAIGRLGAGHRLSLRAGTGYADRALMVGIGKEPRTRS